MCLKENTYVRDVAKFQLPPTPFCIDVEYLWENEIPPRTALAPENPKDPLQDPESVF